MKYTIENDDISCRATGESVAEVMDKMYAIADESLFIVTTLSKQYSHDSLVKNKSQSEIERIGNYCLDEVSVDFESASDEFYMEFSLNNQTELVHVEVVTEEVARRNDLDFLEEEVENYVLGGKNSYYTKLGRTKFYFRFI